MFSEATTSGEKAKRYASSIDIGAASSRWRKKQTVVARDNLPLLFQRAMALAVNTADELVDFVEAHSELNVNTSNDYGWTLLHIASESGNLACVQRLVQSGANVTARDHRGFDALSFAATNDHHMVVIFLIRHSKGTFDERNIETAMLCAARNGSHHALHVLFKARKLLVDDVPTSKACGPKHRRRCPLWAAASHKQANAFDMLVVAGVHEPCAKAAATHARPCLLSHLRHAKRCRDVLQNGVDCTLLKASDKESNVSINFDSDNGLVVVNHKVSRGIFSSKKAPILSDACDSDVVIGQRRMNGTCILIKNLCLVVPQTHYRDVLRVLAFFHQQHSESYVLRNAGRALEAQVETHLPTLASKSHMLVKDVQVLVDLCKSERHVDSRLFTRLKQALDAMLHAETEVKSIYSHLNQAKRLANETSVVLEMERHNASSKYSSDEIARLQREQQCVEASLHSLKNIEERLENANLALPLSLEAVPDAQVVVDSQAHDNNLCFSCGKRQRTWRFLPCQHLALCNRCAGALDRIWKTCIVCDTPVESKKQIFVGF